MSAAERMEDGPGDPPALATALRLLDSGLWPIPISSPEDERPWVKTPGKQPAAGRNWGKVRPTADWLRAFWAGYPTAGVGIKLGRAAGVVDVEVDDMRTGPGTVEALLDGEAVATMGWSAAKGPHHLFRWDDRLSRYEAVYEHDPRLPGLGLRFGSADEEGSQIQSVCPPSPTTYKVGDATFVGKTRAWNGVEVIAKLPDSFFANLDRILAAPKSPPPDREPSSSTVPPGAGTSGRWSAVDRARAYLAKVPPAISGQGGHNQTIKTACNAGPGFDLTEEQFLPIFREWSARCEPPWSEKELIHKIKDGYAREKKRGWLLEEEEKSSWGTPLTPLTPKGGHETGSNGAYGVKGVNGVPPDEIHEPPIVVRAWPDPPRSAAFTGLAGEIVAAIEPYTEADPIAVLIQFLVGFGNLLGRLACFVVEADIHYLNLFVCIVGLSSKGRKGTSWGAVRWLLSMCDAGWEKDHVLGGLVSGEGMIWAVRDEIEKDEAIKQKGLVTGYQKIRVDAGIEDKRALFLETEMGRVLKVMNREGNTLSDLIRQAWETGNLRSATKNNPAKATGAHISIVGHITTGEAAKYLTETEAGNGFGNRFIWACVRRSKLLPRGAKFRDDLFVSILERLRHRIDIIKDLASTASGGRIVLCRDAQADVYWDSVYNTLSEGKPGLLGSIVGRGEAQVMRLACLYALLDGRMVIQLEHIDAALALWKYCEDSARYTFGDALGDRDADHLLSALRSHPLGLTRSQIRSDVFNRNKSADEIARILGRLLEFGRVRSEVIPTDGRPATVWYAAVVHATPPPVPLEATALGWLKEWLARGTGRPESTRQQARDAGFHDTEIERAFVDLGVIVRRRSNGEWCGLPDAPYWGYHDDWED